ncbi:probable folate-biopterin transporter 6 [Aristolochia californica]|uniref:probable folate-biopterin transporter 6 n=1 Tax=Aristolochia californica TaxID=171875 RepID=UPI0035E373C7
MTREDQSSRPILMDSSETQDLVLKRSDSAPEKIPPVTHQHPQKTGLAIILSQPSQWLRMLCKELNGSFVLGVVLVYGFSQGFSMSFFKVVTDYYWKDVKKVQPSSVQMFIGLYYIPWIMKPLWGLLTDVFPINGYKRRPYFLLAGILGTTSAFIVSTNSKLTVVSANICLIGFTTGVAIADVTIDACIAKNSIEKPSLATDMQSLCSLCTSVGALLGYSMSGIVVHLFGAQGALGLLTIPPALLILLGFVSYEQKTVHSSDKRKAFEKVGSAMIGICKTIKCSQVWKPSLYMYLSLSLSFSTHEGQFYWYTDPKAGPAFSEAFLGFIYAIGALASIAGILIYHKVLKDYPFRNLLFFAQLFYAVSGMLDLIFIFRWNLKLGIPDYVFVVMEESCSRIISKIRWMPMVILSSKLCPLGIEGTFFALLMCIDSLGSLTAKSSGGMVLHLFNVTRTDFTNLWLVVFIRNLLRIGTLGLVFLVPKADQSHTLLPSNMLTTYTRVETEEEGLQLVTVDEKTKA